MTYHWCLTRIQRGAFGRTGTGYLSGVPEFTVVFSGVRVVICVAFRRSLFVLWYFFDHCVVCPSSIYAFWLPFWYLVAIVLSVLLLFTPSDYLPFFYLRLLITCPSIYAFWLPALLLFTPSDYLPFFYLRLLITLLVSSNFSYHEITIWNSTHTCMYISRRRT
jgi:hypothetical protein